jgi:hypothetical protein
MINIQTVFKHLPHYIVIIGIFILGAWAFVNFNYDNNFRLGISLAMGVSYFCWGVIHHIIHHDLTLEVALEYLFVSCLGVITLISLIFEA